jgi:predicted  nucleic acid-binding Zn-ribbon protein
LEGKAQEVRGLEGEVRSVREEMEAFSKANGSEREAMLARELEEATGKALSVSHELEEVRVRLHSAEEAAAGAERAQAHEQAADGEVAALKDAVAARDATIKRLEGEIGQAKADVVSVVNSSGSEREKMLAAQSQEASEKVMSLEKELESAVAKLDGAMKQGAEAEMA